MVSPPFDLGTRWSKVRSFLSPQYWHENLSLKKTLNLVKFGFIEGEEGKDIFVHANNLTDQISDGDKVTYDVEDTPKGPSAINVKIQ